MWISTDSATTTGPPTHHVSVQNDVVLRSATKKEKGKIIFFTGNIRADIYILYIYKKHIHIYITTLVPVSTHSVCNSVILFEEEQKLKGKMGTATCVDIILAIILPPLGVFLKFGCKVLHFLFLFFFPNIIFTGFLLFVCLFSIFSNFKQ